MGMMSEFKAFAMKGNVMDLAVGVIIGAAFGKIVDSMVGDIIMPVIGAILGGKLDFSSLLIPLGEVPAGTAMTLDALKKAGVPVFAYGSFITIVINFVLLAFIIFMTGQDDEPLEARRARRRRGAAAPSASEVAARRDPRPAEEGPELTTTAVAPASAAAHTGFGSSTKRCSKPKRSGEPRSRAPVRRKRSVAWWPAAT